MRELTKLGIQCEEVKKQEGIRIYPGIIHAETIETYEDHRMAMAFTLIGLRVGEVKISNPNCVLKHLKTTLNLLMKLPNDRITL